MSIYIYAAASDGYGAAVWNDARDATDCPAIDAWRAGLRGIGPPVPRPASHQDCPLVAGDVFANTDIFGGS